MTGAQDCAQVDSKEVSAVEAKANGTHAEKGVCFVRQAKSRSNLVPADIQRPDDHRPLIHHFPDLTQGRELFLFARSIISIQEKKLGAEEADPFCAAFQGICGFGGMAKICEDADDVAVFGNRALVAEAGCSLAFLLVQFLACLQVAVICQATG